jgi:hypothetical protein
MGVDDTALLHSALKPEELRERTGKLFCSLLSAIRAATSQEPITARCLDALPATLDVALEASFRVAG